MELSEILHNTWEQLQASTENTRHPFYAPVLGTTSHDGSCALRTVILRHVEPTERLLFAYSDVRTAKINHLAQDNRVSWLFYDAIAKVQARFTGIATVHTTDELAQTHWGNTDAAHRLHYCGVQGSGVVCAAGEAMLPAALSHRLPTEAESEQYGRANFAVIRAVVQRLDWLILSREEYRRAQFDWQEAHLSATWITL